MGRWWLDRLKEERKEEEIFVMYVYVSLSKIQRDEMRNSTKSSFMTDVSPIVMPARFDSGSFLG